MKHRHHSTLFSPTGLLEFVVFDIPGLPSRKNKIDQFFSIITNRYSNLTRSIPTANTSVLYFAIIPFDNWIILYGILSFLSTDNGPRFVAMLYYRLCLDVEFKHLTTTSYHPQTNSHVERFDNILVAGLATLHNKQPKELGRVRPATDVFGQYSSPYAHQGRSAEPCSFNAATKGIDCGVQDKPSFYRITQRATLRITAPFTILHRAFKEGCG